MGIFADFHMAGYGRRLRLRYVWRRGRKEMDKAFSRMVGEEPDEDSGGLYGWISKVRGKDSYCMALSGVGRSLQDTVIHECCHLGQLACPRNREQAAELTAQVAGEVLKQLRGVKGTRL